MTEHETCWTLIQDAAAGDTVAKAAFGRRYLHAVREYLAARWRSSPWRGEVDDAVQEVFLEFYREGGALSGLSPERGKSFRAFLFGVTRNVAKRVEQRAAQSQSRRQDDTFDPAHIEAEAERLSLVFDRSWALQIMKEAGQRHRERAAEQGEGALERVELLELRFRHGLPIREIARRWEVEPERLHREFAKARREFEQVLRDVVGWHCPGRPGDLAREVDELLDSLGGD
jgi:RNA polymerase sigma factor (sigma-70 family)